MARSTHAPQAAKFIGTAPGGKEQFFDLLDEYFATRGQQRVVKARSTPLPPAPGPRQTVATVLNDAPQSPEWARPLSTPRASISGDGYMLSHPPAASRSCNAEDAGAEITLFQQSEAWWENQPAQPPCLKGRADIMWTMSAQMSYRKQVFGAALFSDLSCLWYQVDTVSGSRNVADASLEALYTARPAPLDHANAEWAAEVFNETVASFAEQAEASRRPVGDGECWTLAAEALKSIDPSLPPHVPSISRTHGSLIYSGKATGKGRANQIGRWRGGDTHVRRGDIVEWRKVTISFAGGYSKLGNPDHTAVIVRDAIPQNAPVDGQSLLPVDIGSLEVIEQSAGKVPTRATYRLDGLSEGEMWIYRPCAYEQLGLPSTFSANWPPAVPALTPR